MTTGVAASVGTQCRDAIRALMAAGESVGQGEVDAIFSRAQYNWNKTLDTAAGTDFIWHGPVTKAQFLVDTVTLGVDLAVTANDTTFSTIALAYDDGAGGAATTVASVVTNVAGGSWTVGTRVTLAITAANALIPAGKQLKLVKTHGSTGTVIGGGTIDVSGYYT